MQYDSVIGLEIHLQLATRSKMFCACPSGAKADMAPNTTICPLCTGEPGTLPRLNAQAVRLAVRAASALNAKINKASTFARKNYFYPDLPKAYQTTQDDKPIVYDGYVEILDDSGAPKKIGVTRAHLEEDAAKALHYGDYSLIDFNRSSVPLLEIVSEPDLRSPGEAYNYLKTLKQLMQWFAISGADMEKGELRVDVNLSLMPAGAKEFGTRIEIKNLNSFKAVKDALTYEIARQAEVLDGGGKITRCTMLWDEAAQKTQMMRVKETAQEYRYFPEPDLPPLILSDDFINEIKAAMPPAPAAKKAHYTGKLGLSGYDADLLTANRGVSVYFEAALAAGAAPKAATNWIAGDILAKLCGESFETCKFTPAQLAALLKNIESGKISGKMAKEVFATAWQSGKDVGDVIEALGGAQVSDEAQLEAWAREAIAQNPRAADDVRAGNAKAVGALVGAVMKKSQGKANPGALNKIFAKLLK